MPIYEYHCKNCNSHKDVLHNINGIHAVKCEKCGLIMDKIFSAPAVHFGGADWKNDWQKKNKKGN